MHFTPRDRSGGIFAYPSFFFFVSPEISFSSSFPLSPMTSTPSILPPLPELENAAPEQPRTAAELTQLATTIRNIRDAVSNGKDVRDLLDSIPREPVLYGVARARLKILALEALRRASPSTTDSFIHLLGEDPRVFHGAIASLADDRGSRANTDLYTNYNSRNRLSLAQEGIAQQPDAVLHEQLRVRALLELLTCLKENYRGHPQDVSAHLLQLSGDERRPTEIAVAEHALEERRSQAADRIYDNIRDIPPSFVREDAAHYERLTRLLLRDGYFDSAFYRASRWSWRWQQGSKVPPGTHVLEPVLPVEERHAIVQQALGTDSTDVTGIWHWLESLAPPKPSHPGAQKKTLIERPDPEVFQKIQDQYRPQLLTLVHRTLESIAHTGKPHSIYPSLHVLESLGTDASANPALRSLLRDSALRTLWKNNDGWGRSDGFLALRFLGEHSALLDHAERLLGWGDTKDAGDAFELILRKLPADEEHRALRKRAAKGLCTVYPYLKEKSYVPQHGGAAHSGAHEAYKRSLKRKQLVDQAVQEGLIVLQ